MLNKDYCYIFINMYVRIYGLRVRECVFLFLLFIYLIFLCKVSLTIIDKLISTIQRHLSLLGMRNAGRGERELGVVLG